MGIGEDGLEKYVEKEVVFEEERGVIDAVMRFSGATWIRSRSLPNVAWSKDLNSVSSSTDKLIA